MDGDALREIGIVRVFINFGPDLVSFFGLVWFGSRSGVRIICLELTRLIFVTGFVCCWHGYKL